MVISVKPKYGGTGDLSVFNILIIGGCSDV